MDLESIQITLNSRYATKYINNSHSNCEFYLPIIEIPTQHHIYLSVVNAIIPYTFYNINSLNNTLIYVIDGVDTILSIDIGNYNAIQLASYLTKWMPNFTVKYSTITNQFTFTNSVSNFSFNPLTTCFDVLGFDAEQPLYLQSILKELTSEYCANMQSVQCVNIISNFLTGNINSYDMKTNRTLCCIPVNSQPYTNIVYENSTNFRSNLYTNIINYINIQLTDQQHNTLNLNGLDWTIVLQIDVVSFI
jgi:hypothetical protein